MPRLNEAQQRAVTVRLRALEQMMLDFERRVDADEEGILLRVQTRVTQEQRLAFQSLFGQIRAEIRRVADEFQLETETQDGVRALWADASELWADLIDVEPAKLRRYGEVEPELQTTLGPHIAWLVALTSQVFSQADRALAARQPVE